MPDSISTDQDPENLEPHDARETVNQSGGVDIDASRVQVSGDVVGRDKIEHANGNIFHADIVNVNDGRGCKMQAQFIIAFGVVLALVTFVIVYFSRLTEPTPAMMATQTAIAIAILRPSETARATAVVLTPSFSATPTKVLLLPTDTLTPVATPTPTSTHGPTMTPLPPTATPSPPTHMPAPAPTLGIGSTRVWEKDGMVLMYVPAGSFLMGSADTDKDAQPNEKPQKVVDLSAFWIDQTEVTNLQYNKCVQEGKCKPSESANDAIFNGDSQPVVGVGWDDAKAYCEWVGRQLPTEAQWEKAARGTDGRIYPWGDQTATCEYAVMIDGGKLGCGKETTWPVGSKPQGVSPYGALDMAGNVREWVADLYGQYHVLRGGSWVDGASAVRAAFRVIYNPDLHYGGLGFRCVWSGPDK